MGEPVCREIKEASTLLALLANPDRLAIVCLLLEGERSVMQIEIALALHQPSLSQQIGALRRAGLIAGRRAARNIVYRLVDPRAETIVRALRGIYAELLPASALLAGGQDRTAMIEATVAARLAEREWM
jgi:DNA-binding transcriptional ArsR family regulator